MPTRKQRGNDTQNLVAGVFAVNGWPHAESAGAGRAGRDVTGVPGVAVEVKARRGFSPAEWTRQAVKQSDGDLPLVVVRPDGMGPASMDSWPVVMRLSDVLNLLRAAGYGDDPGVAA